MRKIVGTLLAQWAEKDDKIIVLDGDLGRGMFDEFKAKFPGRYFNMGVCEQSMIGVAAGLALEGFTPFVYSITPFLLERPFEQIKIDVDHQKTNVKLIGFADYPGMGPTHAELDWKIIGSCLKNTKCFFPVGNEDEARKALEEAYKIKGPAIVCLKKAKS